MARKGFLVNYVGLGRFVTHVKKNELVLFCTVEYSYVVSVLSIVLLCHQWRKNEEPRKQKSSHDLQGGVVSRLCIPICIDHGGVLM